MKTRIWRENNNKIGNAIYNNNEKKKHSENSSDGS